MAELEAEVAGLLHKPASLFMPSGTMAQQIALRIHADRTVLLWHPTAHPQLHEDQAVGGCTPSTRVRWAMPGAC